MNNPIRSFLSLSEKLQSWLIFLIATSVRLLALLYFYRSRESFVFGDATDYIQYAEFMRKYGFFVLKINGLNAHAGPGYPLVLLLNNLIAGNDSFIFAHIINVLTSGLAAVYVYKISRLFLSEYWTAIASLWYIFYIPHIWQIQFLGKEPIVFVLFLLCIYYTIKISRENRFRFWDIFIFTLAFIYLIHTDERYFMYLIIFIPFILFSKNLFLLGLKKSISILLLVTLLMTPWTIRNFIVFDRIIILTERSAFLTNWLYSEKLPVNPYRLNKIDPDTNEGKEFYNTKTDSIYRGYDISDDRAISKIISDIQNGIERNLIPEVHTSAQEKIDYFIEFWRPFRFKTSYFGHGFRLMDEWSLSNNFISIFQYGFLIPLFIFSLFLGLAQKNRIILLLIGIILFHCTFHVFMAHAITRYRLPIDPLIIILAYYSLQTIWNKYSLIRS